MEALFLSLCAAAVLFSLFMLARNHWVYTRRVALIWSDYEAYNSLPSYGQMMRTFWVWDIRKFVGRP